MIKFFEREKVFLLDNGNISYVAALREGSLCQVHFGRSVTVDGGLLQDEFYPMSLVCPLGDGWRNADMERSEYPVFGRGDFKIPAVQISDGMACEFLYQGYEILAEKTPLEGLPFVRGGETLKITLSDAANELRLNLFYTIYEECNAVTRRAEFVNDGSKSLCLSKAASCALDLEGDFEIIALKGKYAAEGRISYVKSDCGIFTTESTEGFTSHKSNPFVALCREHVTETFGEVYACNLVYGGNFGIEVQKTVYGTTRLVAGINARTFSWELRGGEKFETPECVLVYSSEGLNGMSRAFHRLYNKRLLRKTEGYSPLVLNSWEALSFGFDSEKIYAQIDACKDSGIDTFVLDDGWFSTRNDDKHGLGDWRVNYDKLKDGLKGVAERCRKNGLKFGLWIEPECINSDAPLFSLHKDWVIGGGEGLKSRNQYVLDLTNGETVEELKKTFSVLLESCDISYVKWDMNRYITDAAHGAFAANGEFYHRYILGFYSIAKYLSEKFPDVFFEACAGGGGRMDAGMLAYFNRVWISDATDVHERLKTIRGFSLCYPPSCFSNHVSDVPNAHVGRVTSLKSRFAMNTIGKSGYELDAEKFNKEDFIRLSENYRKIEKITSAGEFYRLTENDGSGFTAFSFVSEDRLSAVLWTYSALADYGNSAVRVKLLGLDENAEYASPEFGLKTSGKNLMNLGVLIKPEYKDFTCKVWVFRAQNLRDGD